jgi:hypothetical protein
MVQKIEELRYIRYRFLFPRDNQEPLERQFTVFLERKSLSLVQPVREDQPIPAWAKLSFSKCRSCPLSENEYQYCPTARSMVDLVEFFSDLPSFQEVKVIVETEKRSISADISVQEGLRGLMGLMMPTSGCPILSNLKAVTYMHLPFSDVDETTFRVVSSYLLGQYFKYRYGGKASFDLDELSKMFEQIHEVNVDFLGRLRAASTNDANLNGLISLDVFTMAVPRAIDTQLQKFLSFYLPDEVGEEDTNTCG